MCVNTESSQFVKKLKLNEWRFDRAHVENIQQQTSTADDILCRMFQLIKSGCALMQRSEHV